MPRLRTEILFRFRADGREHQLVREHAKSSGRRWLTVIAKGALIGGYPADRQDELEGFAMAVSMLRDAQADNRRLEAEVDRLQQLVADQAVELAEADACYRRLERKLDQWDDNLEPHGRIL